MGLNKLYTVIPFYTEKNVQDTISYIECHVDSEYWGIFKEALTWVYSIITGQNISRKQTDNRILAVAYKLAKEEYNMAVLKSDFIAVVRWRYIMTAVSDYMQAIKM